MWNYDFRMWHSVWYPILNQQNHKSTQHTSPVWLEMMSHFGLWPSVVQHWHDAIFDISLNILFLYFYLMCPHFTEKLANIAQCNLLLFFRNFKKGSITIHFQNKTDKFSKEVFQIYFFCLRNGFGGHSQWHNCTYMFMYPILCIVFVYCHNFVRRNSDRFLRWLTLACVSVTLLCRPPRQVIVEISATFTVLACRFMLAVTLRTHLKKKTSWDVSTKISWFSQTVLIQDRKWRYMCHNAILANPYQIQPAQINKQLCQRGGSPRQILMLDFPSIQTFVHQLISKYSNFSECCNIL